MPPGFTGLTDNAQLWVPFSLSGYAPDDRGSRGFRSLARLKPGATIDQARAEMDVISAQLEAAYPATNEKRAVEVSPLAVELLGQLEPIVTTLMAAVSFVLLIACTNVANLLIGRSETRQKEIAVRTRSAQGPRGCFVSSSSRAACSRSWARPPGWASPGRSCRVLPSASPVQFPTFVEPALNLSVLAFTIGVALAGGVLLGLAPALHSRVARLTDALKESASRLRRRAFAAAARDARGRGSRDGDRAVHRCGIDDPLGPEAGGDRSGFRSGRRAGRERQHAAAAGAGARPGRAARRLRRRSR